MYDQNSTTLAAVNQFTAKVTTSIFLFFSFLFFSQIIFSQTVTWDGGGTTDQWNEPANWDTNVVPVITEDVVIGVGFTAEIPNGYIAVGRSLLLDGTLTFISGGESQFGNAITGIVVNVSPSGVLEIQSNSEMRIATTPTIALNVETGGEIINAGTIDINNTGGSITVPDPAFRNYGDVTNSGTIEINNGFNGVRSFGNFTNTSSGLVAVTSVGTGYSALSSGVTINEGDFIFEDVGPGLSVGSPHDFTNETTGSIEVGQFTSRGIRLFSGATVVNKGSIDISGPSAGFSIAFENDADFTNETTGTIDISAGSGGSLTNGGTFINKNAITVVDGASDLRLSNRSTGILTVELGATMNLEAFIENQGELNVVGDITFPLNETTTSVSNRGGTLNIEATGTITQNTTSTAAGRQAVRNWDDGIVNGEGTINSLNVNRGVSIDDGTWSPGFSTGELIIDGDFGHDNTAAIYDYEIQDATDTDLTTVDGDLELGGTLNVLLLDPSFNPALADEFTVFSYTGTLTGTFLSVNLPVSMNNFVVDYGVDTPGEVKLIVNCSSITRTWTGSGDGTQWEDANNWNPVGIPEACDLVRIWLAGADVNIGTAAIPWNGVAGAVSVRNDASLTVPGSSTLSIDGSLGIGAGIDGLELAGLGSTAVFVNEGTTSIANSPFDGMKLSDCELTNDGDLSISNYVTDGISNGRGIRADNASVLINNGSIDIVSTSTQSSTSGIFISGSDGFTNNGMIDISSIAGNGTSAIAISDSELINSSTGSITIDDVAAGRGIWVVFSSAANLVNNGQITVSNTDEVSIESLSSHLSGEGTYTVDNSISSTGSILPGNSPGILNVIGDLTLDGSSALEIEIAGIDGAGMATGHDNIDVDGDVTLTGDLNVSLLGGFDPSTTPSGPYSVVKYTGTLTGTFTTVNLPSPEMDGWLVDYGTLIPGEVIIYRPSNLTQTITSLPNVITGPSNVGVVISLSALDGINGAGEATVRLPKDPRVTFTYDPALTMVGFTAVQNSDWIYDGSNANFHLFKTTAPIIGDMTTSVGINLQYDPEGTTGNTSFTSTLAIGSAGDSSNTNNIDVDVIEYFPLP